MKKLFTSTLILALFLVSFTPQTIITDSRIIDYLGVEKTSILEKNNPDLIRYYNFYLENSYILSVVPNDKLIDNNFTELVLPLSNGRVNTEKLNVLLLDVQRKYDERIYFKVKNSSEVLIFLSEKEFMVKYNNYRRELGLIND